MCRMMDQLDDPDPGTRYRAFERLRELGPRVREALQLRYVTQYAAIRPRPKLIDALGRLIIEIQARYGISPVCVNGVECQIVTDLVWHRPAAGTAKEIQLGLKITNRREEKIALEMLNWVKFELWATNGQPVRNLGYALPFSWMQKLAIPVLAKGESYTLKTFSANLAKTQDGRDLSLEVKDDAVVFRYSGLAPGRFFLRFGWCTHNDCSPAEGTPKWLGIVSPLVAIDIE
jgi:hypothetical protein